MVEKQPAFARINLQISVLLYYILLFSPSCTSNFHLQCLTLKTDRISEFFSDFVWVTFQVTCTLFITCSHSCNENCVHFVLVFVVMATLSACPVINGSTGQTQRTYMQIAVNTKCVYTHTYIHIAHNILQITEMQVCHNVFCQTNSSLCRLPVQHDTATYCEKSVCGNSTAVGMWKFTTTHSTD